MSRRFLPHPWNAACLAACLVVGISAGPAFAQDADFDPSELIVRLNRLEGQIRTLSGQVEQQQFENRQLKDQLRKFQEDTEFRFQERGGGGGRSSAAPAPTPSTTPAGGGARPQKRGDAFDPDTSPASPGTPRTLGSAAESGPVAGGNPDASKSAGRPAATASVGGDAQSEYDAAYALYTSKQYDGADAGFRRFLGAHPRDRSAADATYYLGESLLQRNRPRDAAEQFLKISTDYGRSAKAPDALLKLGVSLTALGAKDQACATFAEFGRKYPSASAGLKQGVEREQKKARCPA